MPNRRGWNPHLFSFKYVINDHTKWPTPIIRFFLKISLVVMVEIVDLTPRAVLDSFQIYTINSLIKKIQD